MTRSHAIKVLRRFRHLETFECGALFDAIRKLTGGHLVRVDEARWGILKVKMVLPLDMNGYVEIELIRNSLSELLDALYAQEGGCQ